MNAPGDTLQKGIAFKGTGRHREGVLTIVHENAAVKNVLENVRRRDGVHRKQGQRKEQRKSHHQPEQLAIPGMAPGNLPSQERQQECTKHREDEIGADDGMPIIGSAKIGQGISGKIFSERIRRRKMQIGQPRQESENTDLNRGIR